MPLTLKRPFRLLFAVPAVAALALPLAMASPASAAVSCGSTKTARTSIQYKACWERTSRGHYELSYWFNNNHGSAVTIKAQTKEKYGLFAGWGDETSLKLRATAGMVQRHEFDVEWICDPGNKVTDYVRVRENNGDWGPSATTGELTCS